MKETNMDMVFDALGEINVTIGELASIEYAMEVLGLPAAKKLAHIRRDILVYTKHAREGMNGLVTDRLRETEQATGNMVLATLAALTPQP